MRAPAHHEYLFGNIVTRYRTLLLAAPLSAVSLIALAPGLAAQQSPGSFTLPEPTPSPTPAPQGPVDERAGVPIAPRVIPRETPEPTPPSEPARESSPAPSATAPQPQETQQSQPQSQGSRVPAREPVQRETVQPDPQRGREPASGPDEAASSSEASPSETTNDPNTETEVAQPGFEGLPLPGEGAGATAAPDRGIGMAGQTEPRAGAGGEVSPVPASSGQAIGQRWALLAAIALLLSLIAGIVWLAWRGRRSPKPDEAGARRLLTNVSQALAERMPAAFPDTPRSGRKPASARPATSNPVVGAGARADAGAAEPARIDLKLAIVNATRSLKVLSIECRIDVANRSDRAVRNLSVFAQLDTARQNAGEPGARARENPIGSIERIGPQQGSAIVVTLQMPLGDVHPIRQGNEPLFVPLVHLALDGDSGIARSQSFVLGTLSTANQGRLHPLPLNALPGSITGLKVQPIRKQPPREPSTQHGASANAGPRSPVTPR